MEDPAQRTMDLSIGYKHDARRANVDSEGALVSG